MAITTIQYVVCILHSTCFIITCFFNKRLNRFSTNPNSKTNTNSINGYDVLGTASEHIGFNTHNQENEVEKDINIEGLERNNRNGDRINTDRDISIDISNISTSTIKIVSEDLDELKFQFQPRTPKFIIQINTAVLCLSMMMFVSFQIWDNYHSLRTDSSSSPSSSSSSSSSPWQSLLILSIIAIVLPMMALFYDDTNRVSSTLALFGRKVSRGVLWLPYYTSAIISIIIVISTQYSNDEDDQQYRRYLSSIEIILVILSVLFSFSNLCVAVYISLLFPSCLDIVFLRNPPPG